MERESYSYHDVLREEMIPFVPQGIERLLDVGCGRGGFATAVRRARPSVVLTGVEEHPLAADQAAGRYDRLIRGRYPDDVDDQYDCIVFNDVLEHFEDPWDVLVRTRLLLRPGGAVVASIPNVRYWPVLFDLAMRGDFRYADDGVLDRTHLRFFTRRSAERLFTDAGYSVLTVQGINVLSATALPTGQARALRWMERLRLRAAEDLRAQQFAFVAKP